MKTYKLNRINIDYQVRVLNAPDELVNKGLYEKFTLDKLHCFVRNEEIGLTDILKEGTFSLEGIIVSNKCYEVLKCFNLHEIQFIDITNSDLKDYKFMFFNSDMTYNLDYEKSNFILIEDMLGDRTELNIPVEKNRESVIKAYKDHCVRNVFNRLIAKNGYCFLTDFNFEELDVFRIGHFDKSFYISERVKVALEENKVSGCEFTEQKLLKNLL